jgi:hypothetical protein
VRGDIIDGDEEKNYVRMRDHKERRVDTSQLRPREHLETYFMLDSFNVSVVFVLFPGEIWVPYMDLTASL